MLREGQKVWIKTGELQNKPGKVKSYAGEGYYNCIDENGTLRLCLLTDLEIIS